MQSIKCVLIGDTGVGKSSLVQTICEGKFSLESSKSILNETCNILFYGKPIQVGLWNTNCSEEWDRLRPLTYPQTDALIICFSISDRNSYENVSSKWLPEIHHHLGSSFSTIVLLGTKRDLRCNPQIPEPPELVPITFQEGIIKAKEINAASYCEVSALLGEGLQELMVEVTSTVIPTPVIFEVKNNRKKKATCVMM